MNRVAATAGCRRLTGPGLHPYASIVVEWENARLSAADRSVVMLCELRRQVNEVASASGTLNTQGRSSFFELLVVYDHAGFDPAGLNELLDACIGPRDAALAWRMLPARHSGYYRNKDFGARNATGDIIVFLDSDVIPEPGWLAQIISPFDDHAMRLVAGNTYIQPSGLVGKVFALAWFFPLRSADRPLRPVTSFFVNNLAVRRHSYLEYPLPDLADTSRGACIVLANRLSEAGIPVYHNPMARVSHPPPNGFAHVSKRALAQGRDRLYRERRYGNRWSASLAGSCWRWLRHLGGSTTKICTGFRRAGLSSLLVPAALSVAWYYYTLYWVGEILSHLRVPAIRRVRV